MHCYNLHSAVIAQKPALQGLHCILPSYSRPPSATVVSAEPFSHGTGTLRCLVKEMATYKHWSVSLWRDPDDVPHCRILFHDKTEWRLISATLCGWRRCFVADHLWFMTRIREEEDSQVETRTFIIIDSLFRNLFAASDGMCVNFSIRRVPNIWLICKVCSAIAAFHLFFTAYCTLSQISHQVCWLVCLLFMIREWRLTETVTETSTWRSCLTAKWL